jgi:hypothetical protein
MDDMVSVCMLALALLNKEDAENTKLDDVFTEHQRDGSHCSESHASKHKPQTHHRHISNLLVERMRCRVSTKMRNPSLTADLHRLATDMVRRCHPAATHGNQRAEMHPVANRHGLEDIL